MGKKQEVEILCQSNKKQTELAKGSHIVEVVDETEILNAVNSEDNSIEKNADSDGVYVATFCEIKEPPNRKPIIAIIVVIIAVVIAVGTSIVLFSPNADISVQPDNESHIQQGTSNIIQNYAFDGKVLTIYSDSYFEQDYKTFNSSGSISSVEKIVINDGVTKIAGESFKNYSNLKSIDMANGIISIGNAAFSGCESLKKVDLPDGVINIGARAFENCTGIENIATNMNLSTIGEYAFSGCKALTSIAVPDNAISVGKYAFYDCSGLTRAVMGTNVTTIGQNAFDGCKNLISIVIPQNIKNIDLDAFRACDKLVIYADKGGYAETYANNHHIQFIELIPLENNSELSAYEINLGTKISVNIKADGGNGDNEYGVYYKKSYEKQWTTVQDYSKNDKVTIKPLKATDYDVCVKIKDKSGKVAKKYFSVKVNEK